MPVQGSAASNRLLMRPCRRAPRVDWHFHTMNAEIAPVVLGLAAALIGTFHLRKAYTGGNGAHKLLSLVSYFVAAVFMLVALAGGLGS
jgi:hypothetical protein